jgi:hypothetical protein
MHETVKEPALPSPLLRRGSLLFGLIVLGGTVDAAGIGLNLRVRTTFRTRLQGHAIRALAWEQASRRRRGCIEIPAVFK